MTLPQFQVSEGAKHMRGLDAENRGVPEAKRLEVARFRFAPAPMLAVTISKGAVDQGTKTKILFRQIAQGPVGIGLRLHQIVLHACDGTANSGYLRQLPARVVTIRSCQLLLDVIDTAHAGIERAGEGQKTRPSEVERGVGSVPRRRQRIEPALHDRVLAALKLCVGIAVENLDREVEVVPGNGMMEGLFREVVRQIPSSRPAMEFDGFLGMKPVKFTAQEVSEKPVIAKPLLGGVQRHEKQILPFQELQHLLPTGRPSHGVAERTAEAIEDAGLQQEATGLIG